MGSLDSLDISGELWLLSLMHELITLSVVLTRHICGLPLFCALNLKSGHILEPLLTYPKRCAASLHEATLSTRMSPPCVHVCVGLFASVALGE